MASLELVRLGVPPGRRVCYTRGLPTPTGAPPRPRVLIAAYSGCPITYGLRRRSEDLATLRHTASVAEYVYSVHTARPDDVGAVEAVFLDEHEARAYARDRSSDYHILSASVTRFRVAQLGTRTALALYVDGQEKSFHDRSVRREVNRLYPAG